MNRPNDIANDWMDKASGKDVVAVVIERDIYMNIQNL